MIRYLDNKAFLDISLFLKKCYFGGFYTNCQSLYHELKNTLHADEDNNICLLPVRDLCNKYPLYILMLIFANYFVQSITANAYRAGTGGLVHIMMGS